MRRSFRQGTKVNATALDLVAVRRSFFRVAALATVATLLSLFALRPAHAQRAVGVGSSISPYVGYLVTGKWYDGPAGTTLVTSNAPLVGVQIGVPLSTGVSLVGNLAYTSGDLRVGLPSVGGVNVGTNKMWLYDAGLEIGGLRHHRSGVAPYLLGGIGAATTDIKNALFTTRSSDVMYNAGFGIDFGMSRSAALRVQAKDYIGRFDSQEAVGFHAEGNLAQNWAFSAGVKLAF